MTQTRTLGDAEVFPIGLGGMPLSLSGRPDEDRAIRTIHAALDAGVNLIDTADAYASTSHDIGHNERLIAKALRGRRDGVLVATKGGHTRKRRGAGTLDGRPEHIRAACEASLRALETDVIDLYQFHRPDPDVPVRRVDRRVPGAPGRGQGALGRRSPTRAWSSSRRRSAIVDDRRACRTSSRSTSRRRSARARWRPPHGARDRVPALVAARRDRQGRTAPADGRAGRRGGRGARRLAAAGRARLAARRSARP